MSSEAFITTQDIPIKYNFSVLQHVMSTSWNGTSLDKQLEKASGSLFKFV